MRLQLWVELRSFQLPIAESGDDVVDHRIRHCRVEVGAEAQQVGTGAQRVDSCVADSGNTSSAGDRIHVECIGDDRAVESEHGAEEIGPVRAERGRRVVDGRGNYMRGQDGVGSRVDGCAEWQQFAFGQSGDRRGDSCRVVMRVGGGVTVAGKVLGGHREAAAMEPVDSGDDVSSDEVGSGAERPHADDRISRIGVDVCAWRQGQVDAQPADPAAEIGVGVGGEADVVDEPERGG